MDYTMAMDWAALALRWLHIISAMAWIGSSFYFIALDLSLRPETGAPQGVHGAAWQVHGGGFYHIQKYLVAPERMPADLTWFKWESYVTWGSGAGLLAAVYWYGAEVMLLDPRVWEASEIAAISVSGGSLILGWLGYNALCKTAFGADNRRLMLALYALLVVIAWGYTQLFSGRAAFLHLGALTATIMTANVFLIIIPNQKIVVADLLAGRVPDARYGKIAKQRSTHNNYLTLPVVFFMLSNHYPLAFAAEWNWLIAALVFLLGVTIRLWFNARHAGSKPPIWAIYVSVALFLAMVGLSLRGGDWREAAAEGADFAAVVDLVTTQCAMCHAQEPAYDGLKRAPKNLHLETAEQIHAAAREIYLQAGVSSAMPPGSFAVISPQERRLIVEWYRAGGLM